MNKYLVLFTLPAFFVTLTHSAAATPVHFAECTTVMDGLPASVSLFENRDDAGQPDGTGTARVKHPMLDTLVEETPDLGSDPNAPGDLRTNRLVLTQSNDHRRVQMYASMDPKTLFVDFELPVAPGSTEVKMRTPMGMVWGDFVCTTLAE